ncbi:MAG: dihydroorotate dehydrogenase-like protein [Cytophagales bacterium]|nr:dihydroorotate dehydrogenase-like protein [Cytophagales bacterium]
MSLKTSVMGMELSNPIIVGSSSLTSSVRNIKKCEEAGAAAVVLKSLYEEQILANTDQMVETDEMYQWYPEAMEFINTISVENGIERYLDLVRECKENVSIPVIASINCFSSKNWMHFSKELENAGADALELNVSIFPEDAKLKSADIEYEYFNIVKSVKKIIKIPVSVKMSSYFTNIKLAAKGLESHGAEALVLFNRYYRPDIDIDNLRMITRDTLSGPEEITQSLRWIGLLSEKLKCDMVASTGIHDASAIIKQLLAGAKAVQICSVLYENGIDYIGELISEIEAWMKRKGFKTIDAFRGLINMDPHNSISWERIHFMKKTSGNIIKPIMR